GAAGRCGSARRAPRPPPRRRRAPAPDGHARRPVRARALRRGAGGPAAPPRLPQRPLRARARRRAPAGRRRGLAGGAALGMTMAAHSPIAGAGPRARGPLLLMATMLVALPLIALQGPAHTPPIDPVNPGF